MTEIKYRFKKYLPKNKKYNTPAATIAIAQIRLNHHCRNFLERKPYCELFYDRYQKVIAIKPIHVETSYSMKINNHQRKDCNMAIQCRAFLKEDGILEYLGLGKLKSLQFPAQWDEKNKMFFVNLKYFKEQINAE